jgi:hypothetical protein
VPPSNGPFAFGGARRVVSVGVGPPTPRKPRPEGCPLRLTPYSRPDRYEKGLAWVATKRQHMLTFGHRGDSMCPVDIEAGARKHGVSDEDMIHALRHYWRAFETDDPAVMMLIGPSTTG